MPRFDGTGPDGRGPKTGRGRGFCDVNRPVRINRFRRVLRRLRRFGRGENFRVIRYMNEDGE